MADIVLDNCFYSYSNSLEEKVLSGVSLRVEAGSFISVIGPNGSGKSTLAKLLNGLYIPSSGIVEVDGLSTREKKNIPQIRRKVALLFQNPDNQIVGDTVEDDTAFGPENLGLDRDEITKRVEDSLSKVGLLEKRKMSPNTLSGGEKARLGIAGVLALNPEVLVLDEATAMLDPEGRKEVMAILQDLWKYQGKTIILITHHPEETIYGERIVVLDKGEIKLDGSVAEVYRKSETLKKLGLELPPYVELSLLLKEKGVIDDIAFDSSSLCPLLESKI
ncbi:MAG: energy-coupling factor transporter ATPase [Candidatus Ornithospirochaeta sp.]